MIQLHDVSLAFGGHPVLRSVSWAIRPGERIGLIGANGAGKTTLMRVIDGRQTPDAGRVDRGSQTIGYLEQGVQEIAPGRTVREEALDAFRDVDRLRARERRITEALDASDDPTTDAYERLLHDLDRVQTQLVACEAHTVASRTEAALTGLGFDPDALDRPLADFSGGWRMRAVLARLLLRQPDVLLLDEPTNHLDIDAIDWLEGYLRGYPGTVVLTSHDRYFLDRMVTSIAELARGRVEPYAGNYSFYLDERAKRRELQQAAYENQQRKIKETERFIERFRYKASKASQVQSRIKQLEKMERLEPPPPLEATLTLRFPEPPRSGHVVLRLSRFAKHYDTAEGPVEVFEDAGPLTVERGDKIALIGPNGAGKSTLARMLFGTEPFDGDREVGHKVQSTFFAQHQTEALDASRTVLESLREAAPARDVTDLRTMLGAFLFTGDDVFKPVSVLSGGEKSRVALARTLCSPANFLVLDEPTNHLDLQSKQVLVEALQQYSGTLVLVSHDRHFLDQVATRVWRVGDGRVQAFPGTFAEYRWHREHGTTASGNAASGNAASGSADADASSSAQAPPTNGQANDEGGPKTKAQKRREAEARQQRYEARQDSSDPLASLNAYQLRKRLEKVEAKILEKETTQEEMETRLAEPTLYDDPDEARALNEAYGALKSDLVDLYHDWEHLAELLAARQEA